MGESEEREDWEREEEEEEEEEELRGAASMPVVLLAGVPNARQRVRPE